MKHIVTASALASAIAIATLAGQTPPQPDWKAREEETMRHYQAVLRIDTQNPPGNETKAAEYVKQALEKEGIPAQIAGSDPNRSNVFARLKGSGRKRPLLIMGHTDVVTVDAAKWKHGPFSATREGGYIYGRGTVDDKDNLVAALMTIVDLKRRKVPLDRDVILLAEAGEEGATQYGIEFMVNEHLKEIEGEFCLAEGGNVSREGGKVKFAAVQTTEKIPRAIVLTATGVAGHGSIPLLTNPIKHLSAAVTKVADWQAPLRLNE